jgi:transcription antitermination factor NusG
VKLDGTASPIIADENERFPKGNHVTGLDGQSGQGMKGTPSSEESFRKKWSENPTSWGYLFMHNKKVVKFETEVNADGSHRCFVHRSVYYEKAPHGVKKILKPTVSGFVFLQGRTLDLQRYLHDKYQYLHLVNDRNTGRPAVIPDSQMQPFMQIMKDDPTRIRILQHPIERYAEGNTRVRILTGILKGQEGYIIRINRDRKLVMEIGDMTVAIGDIHQEKTEPAESASDPKGNSTNGGNPTGGSDK